ncbi:MAG: sulfatase-like hydrolase/transferase [Clostridia bacterium]
MKKNYNLLFIFTDEQRTDTLGYSGNKQISTPNMDKLAEDACYFSNCYDTQPVCTPARGTLLTGLFPHNSKATCNNAFLGNDVKTLAEMLDNDVYKARGYIGKWHLGDELVCQHGFNHWVSVEDMYCKYHSKEEYQELLSDYHNYLIDNGFTPNLKTEKHTVFSRDYSNDMPDKFTKTAFVADKTIDYITEHKDENFVAFVNFLDPHPPITGPLNDMYDPEKIELPSLFSEFPDKNSPLRHHSMKKFIENQLGSEQEWRKYIARYMGQVTHVDNHLGRILDSVKENGLEDNTIIVFTSDHGDMMGDFKLNGKGVQYESSVRVPLIVKIPGVAAQNIDVPFSHIDLIPTILDAMQTDCNAELDGESVYSSLKENKGIPERDVFIEWNPDFVEAPCNLTPLDGVSDDVIFNASKASMRTVLSGDYKLCLSDYGDHQLYNISEPLGETINLYNKEEYKTIIKELSEKIYKWQEKTKDNVSL